MEAERFLEILIAALVASLAGPGVLWRIGLSAMETRFVPLNKLYDENGTPLFPTRPEMNGMSKRRDEQIAELSRRLDSHGSMLIAHNDRITDVDTKLKLMEQQQAQLWGQISREIASSAAALADATLRLERVSETQNTLALRMERLDALQGDAGVLMSVTRRRRVRKQKPPQE